MDTQRVSSIRIMAATLAMLSCTAVEATSTPLAAQPTVAVVAASSTGAPPSLEEMLAQRDRASRLTLGGHYAAARVQ